MVRGRRLALRCDGAGILLRFDPAADVMPLVRAASERKEPLKLLDVAAPAEIIREAVLALLRPDQHVGWRGQARQPIHWP